MLALIEECWVHSQPEGWLRRQATGFGVDDWSRSPSIRRAEKWAEDLNNEPATILPFVAPSEPVSDQYRKNLEVARLLAVWEEQDTEEDMAHWKDFEEELRASRRD